MSHNPASNSIEQNPQDVDLLTMQSCPANDNAQAKCDGQVGHRGHVKFSGQLDTGTAQFVKEALLEALASGASVIDLDLLEVSGCGTAALQLFLAAKKSAELGGRRLHISAWGPVMKEISQSIGISPGALGGVV